MEHEAGEGVRFRRTRPAISTGSDTTRLARFVHIARTRCAMSNVIDRSIIPGVADVGVVQWDIGGFSQGAAAVAQCNGFCTHFQVQASDKLRDKQLELAIGQSRLRGNVPASVETSGGRSICNCAACDSCHLTAKEQTLAYEVNGFLTTHSGVILVSRMRLGRRPEEGPNPGETMLSRLSSVEPVHVASGLR